MAEINTTRPMLSLTSAGSVRIVAALAPAENHPSCCRCCSAPRRCPCLCLCPCWSLPHATLRGLRASRYARLRENSLEVSSPFLLLGCCCQVDRVEVVHYDQARFRGVAESSCVGSRCCSYFVGGEGEAITLLPCDVKCVREKNASEASCSEERGSGAPRYLLRVMLAKRAQRRTRAKRAQRRTRQRRAKLLLCSQQRRTRQRRAKTSSFMLAKKERQRHASISFF
jgi:hypothetical protein